MRRELPQAASTRPPLHKQPDHSATIPCAPRASPLLPDAGAASPPRPGMCPRKQTLYGENRPTPACGDFLAHWPVQSVSRRLPDSPTNADFGTSGRCQTSVGDMDATVPSDSIRRRRSGAIDSWQSVVTDRSPNDGRSGRDGARAAQVDLIGCKQRGRQQRSPEWRACFPTQS